MQPLDQMTFEAGALLATHPPQLYDDNKILVFEIARSSGFPFEGPVAYARWPVQEPPGEVTQRCGFAIQAGIFDYAAPRDPALAAWHVNFADPELFVAYGSPLLAQDELQVAEHPILGSLREALLARGMPALTVDESGQPTPVTVTGVQRRCFLETRPSLVAGSPAGLYGGAFALAAAEQVRAATRALSPPTVSNILAMAAPMGGSGAYTLDEMLGALRTAYTGFAAARQESGRLAPGITRTVVHTGFWGCGVFGGSRTLMTILQSLAADLAGVDLVFWTVGAEGARLGNTARERYERLRDITRAVPELMDALLEEGFAWGVSDGN